MCDEQHGELAFTPDPLDLVVQHVPGHRIQRAERLVHQQHRGVLGKCAGERDPLAHATGQLVRAFVLQTAQVHRLEQFGDPSRPFRSWDIGQLESQRDVAAAP